MVNKAGKVFIGFFGGAALGSGVGAVFNLSFLGAPIGAILFTGILLEIHNRKEN